MSVSGESEEIAMIPAVVALLCEYEGEIVA